MPIRNMTNRKTYEKYFEKHFPEYEMRDVYYFHKDLKASGINGLHVLEGARLYFIFEIGEAKGNTKGNKRLLMFANSFDLTNLEQPVAPEILENVQFEYHFQSKKMIYISNTKSFDGVYHFLGTSNKKSYNKKQWVEYFVNGGYRDNEQDNE
jgi:hypothetical protein